MTKNDFTCCRGYQCPSRNQCRRYVDGLKAEGGTKFIQSCRHAKMFIHKDLKKEPKVV